MAKEVDEADKGRQTVKNRPVRFDYIHSGYPSSIGGITDLMEISKDDPNVSFIRHQIPYRSVPAGIPEMLEYTQKAISLLKDKVFCRWPPAGALA